MTRFGYKKESLGQGGFGEVYPAYRLDDEGNRVDENDDLAMKLLKREWCDSEEVVARFKREVQLQQQELDHENVMPIVARNLSADPPYFVMPRATHDLKSLLEDGLADRRDEAMDIFHDVLDAIAHAHERGVIHRDIKPGNVLFVEETPKVSDFGFGKRMAPDATDLTQTGQWFGSQRYMAPEQMSAREVTPAADVYSLGKVLGELLTGERPEAFLFEKDKMPQEFRYFLGRCCDSDPTKRYSNAREMQDALRVLTSPIEVVDPPIEGAERIIQNWMIEEEGPDRQEVENLDAHLRRYESEEELFSRVIPRLPPALIAQYEEILPDGLRHTLEVYDGHIDGPLAFTYCDVIADFYLALWDQTDDDAIKRLIVERLWRLGPEHNRWHVGQQFAKLVKGTENRGDALLIAEVMKAQPRFAEWYEGYLEPHGELIDPIRDGITEAVEAAAAERAEFEESATDL